MGAASRDGLCDVDILDIAECSPDLLAAAAQDVSAAADKPHMTDSHVGAATARTERVPERESVVGRFFVCEALREREGLRTLVTGVQSAEHMALARSSRSGWAQGHLLGEPTSSTDAAPGASAPTA